MRAKKAAWPPPSPRDRRPIGYEIKPQGDGWIAFLVREGDAEHGGSAIPIGRSRSQRACRRQAERAVRSEKARFDHEHASGSDLVIMYSGAGYEVTP